MNQHPLFAWFLNPDALNPQKQALYNMKGELHCTDGPAVIYTNGDEEWYYDGKLHREDPDLPAVRRKTYVAWYWHGQRHRSGGPACIEIRDGVIRQTWYNHGTIHREDGPAKIEHHVADKTSIDSWYQEGKRHRKNGPAVIYNNGDSMEWWTRGRFDGAARRSRAYALRIIRPSWCNRDASLHHN